MALVLGHSQGLVLLAFVEFPEVFSLSLINDSEDIYGQWIWRAWMQCHLGDLKLRQLWLPMIQLFQQLCAMQVPSLHLGHGCALSRPEMATTIQCKTGIPGVNL